MTKKPIYKTAVGLEYDTQGAAAPTVSAKGEFLSADEIVKIAQRYGVPVIERPSLAKALLPLEVEEQIPEDLFEAVAVVLQEVDKVAK